jgi:hypothetical protein
MYIYLSLSLMYLFVYLSMCLSHYGLSVIWWWYHNI